jgi:hypothetical protein
MTSNFPLLSDEKSRLMLADQSRQRQKILNSPMAPLSDLCLETGPWFAVCLRLLSQTGLLDMCSTPRLNKRMQSLKI